MAQTKEYTSKAGNKYTFQKVTPRAWIRKLDEIDQKGKSREALTEAVLENIVVTPKKTIDDFEDYAELEEVTVEAMRFQQGK
jgi:hypothetical protein